MGGQRPLLGGFMMMVGVVALYRGRLRPWMYTWGAREDEVTAQLRVMSWLRRTRTRTTRAVTIDAPIADVWPWLAQIGEDRGGFYSAGTGAFDCGCPKRDARHTRYVRHWDELVNDVTPVRLLNAWSDGAVAVSL